MLVSVSLSLFSFFLSRRKEGKGSLPVTVGVVGGDIQSSLLADLHVDDTLVPAADDLTDTDTGAEIGLSDGGVEAIGRRVSLWHSDIEIAELEDSGGSLIARRGDVHLALVSSLVLEVAGVLNGDGLSLHGRRAGALGGGGLGNGHDSCGLSEGSGVCEGVCSVDGSSSEGGETGCEAGEEHCGDGGVGR